MKHKKEQREQETRREKIKNVTSQKVVNNLISEEFVSKDSFIGW